MRAGVVTATLLASVTVLPGCATVAQVTNLGEPACRAHVQHALGTILAEQGESQDAASELAERAVEAIAQRDLGPRPFLVAAPSGTDYTFFVQKRSEQCPEEIGAMSRRDRSNACCGSMGAARGPSLTRTT